MKFVLNTIGRIVDESMEMELKYTDIMERYRTLGRYGVVVDEKETAMAGALAVRWRELFCAGKTKDLRLAKVKEEFREVTQAQAQEFQEELKDIKPMCFDNGMSIDERKKKREEELAALKLALCSRRGVLFFCAGGPPKGSTGVISSDCG